MCLIMLFLMFLINRNIYNIDTFYREKEIYEHFYTNIIIPILIIHYNLPLAVTVHENPSPFPTLPDLK